MIAFIIKLSRRGLAHALALRVQWKMTTPQGLAAGVRYTENSEKFPRTRSHSELERLDDEPELQVAPGPSSTVT